MRRIELILVSLFLILRFGGGLAAIDFHPDESQWIATSAALEAFASGDIGAPHWRESYWTLTHPPVTRYVIGVGRRVGGYAAGDLNRPWRWGEDFATNARAGKVPSPRLLWYARLPMAVLAAVAGVVGFFLLANLAGRVAAYAWVAAVAANPYLSATLSRAMSEAPLLCAVLIAMLLAWRTLVAAAGASDTRAARRTVLWLVLVAVACGVAAATKLTGAVLLPALLALAVWVVIRLHRQARIAVRWCILFILLVVETAAFTFVALNPYLYPAPVTRSVRMAEHRRSEMRWQALHFADAQMPAGWQRSARIATRVFTDFAPLRIDAVGVANGALCAFGLVVTLGIWRRSRRPEAASAAAVVVVAAAANAWPIFFSDLDWERYYLLPEVFALMFSCVGAAALLRAIWARVAWPARLVTALPAAADAAGSSTVEG